MDEAPDYTEGRTSIVAATATSDEREAFLIRTALHFSISSVACLVLEGALFASGVAESVSTLLFQFGALGWVAVAVALAFGAYVADGWARSGGGAPMQYAGHGLAVITQSLLAMPLFWAASQRWPGAVPATGLVALVTFGGFGGVVFLLRKDPSVRRTFAGAAMLVAIGVVLAAVVIGPTLFVVVGALLVLLAAAALARGLVVAMHRYKPAQHVAASLALFAGLPLLLVRGR